MYKILVFGVVIVHEEYGLISTDALNPEEPYGIFYIESVKFSGQYAYRICQKHPGSYLFKLENLLKKKGVYFYSCCQYILRIDYHGKKPHITTSTTHEDIEAPNIFVFLNNIKYLWLYREWNLLTIEYYLVRYQFWIIILAIGISCILHADFYLSKINMVRKQEIYNQLFAS